MKVDYVSDLHLEFRNYPNLDKEPGGDLLVLAGDILTARLLEPHRTDQAARKLTKYLRNEFIPFLNKYRNVIYIAGNHEHYDYNYHKSLDNIKMWFYYNGAMHMEFMENAAFVPPLHGEVMFVCATLWTDYNRGSPLAMQAAQEGMNDYRLIYTKDIDWADGPRTITPEFLIDEHTRSVEFIRHVASENRRRKIVVVTHHAPASLSLNKVHSGINDGAYYSDLSHIILNNENITHWIHGHTHHNVEYEIGQCKVMTNCRGYPSEKSFVNWPGLKSFEV